MGRASGEGTPIQVIKGRLKKESGHILPSETWKIVDVQQSKRASQGAEEFFLQGYREQGANLRNAENVLSFDRQKRINDSSMKIEEFFLELFSRRGP